MPLGMLPSGLTGLPRIMKNAPITKRDLPPAVPQWLVEKGKQQGFDPVTEWQYMQGGQGEQPQAAPDMGAPLPQAQSGIFAPDPMNDQPGALSGIGNMATKDAAKTPVKVSMAKEGPNWLDYLGLAGATLQEMGGITGAVNDFTGRRRAMGQENDMNSLLEGLDLSPEELGLVKAGMGREVLAQRVGDKREDRLYQRGRADTIADRTVMRGYDVEDRDLGFKQDNERLDRTLGQDREQFDITMGENRRQFDETMDFNRDKLKADQDLEAAKLIAAANQGAQLDGPQLTTIYNNSLKYIDEQAAILSQFGTIADTSKAFIDKAYDNPADGKAYTTGVGGGESWSQFWDTRSPELEALTSKITPLMRPEGSGSMSDGDRMMFREAVVNIRNREEGNRYAAQAAEAIRTRQSDYVAFLREAIDLNDPTSRQQAQAIWDQYARDVPVFDQKTGKPNTQVMPFEQWLEAAMGGDGAGQSQVSDPLAPARVYSEADLDKLPPGTTFIGPDGVTRVK